MTSELTPIDIDQRPDLAELVEEVVATGKRRRFTRGDRDIAVLQPADQHATAAAEGVDPVLAELARRLRKGMSIVDATAGIIKPYAKEPPPTPREEKDAFEQAVADEVMESMGG